MDIIISGRHMAVTEPMEQHARDKSGKLTRYFDRLAKIEIVIDKSQDGHSYDVEFIAHVDGQDHLVANANHDDAYHAIEHAVQKMERQLTDLKEKLRDHKH